MNSNGYPEGPGTGFSGVAAPPPPPPPPVPGQVPALRINTASETSPRRPQPSGPQDPYEPPAAIQNAMMTKDKKPFTYTPGMGGKLDLSQIRSPRMARRVAKNAEDEGIEGPPKAALQDGGAPPPQCQQQPSIYSHPQVAIPVFPQNMPQQPPVNLRNTVPRSPVGTVVERQEPPPRPAVKIETRMQPQTVVDNGQSPTPPTPQSPTQVTLSKAPTPWMQKPTKQPEAVPEWAKKAPSRPDIQFDDDVNAMMYQQPPSQPRTHVVIDNTPSNPRPVQQQYIPQHQMRQLPQENKFVVPRIEERPSVFTAMNDGASHHQLMNSNPHHQSRWGNPVGQSAPMPQQTQGGAYIIPVQIEGQQNTVSSPSNGNHQPPQYNRSNSRGYAPPSPSQMEPGPVQSKAFRVLQKITDTDADQPDGEQLRKLQLTEDDRYLMDKFKEQVDGENYLHQVEDPRYRGAAIPSRAFRYLQTMTDSGDVPIVNNTPKPVNSAAKKPNSTVFVEIPVVQHVPASQQQVPEPKKYTGSAIPSRSFRILQAMTAPETVGSQWECNESPMTSSSSPDQPIYTSYSPLYFINSDNNNESIENNKEITNDVEENNFVQKKNNSYINHTKREPSPVEQENQKIVEEEGGEEIITGGDVKVEEAVEELEESDREVEEEEESDEEAEEGSDQEVEEESYQEVGQEIKEVEVEVEVEVDAEVEEIEEEEEEEEVDEEAEEIEEEDEYEEEEPEKEAVEVEEKNLILNEDESSDSESDSESYLAYEIRQNSPSKDKPSEGGEINEEVPCADESDSTDCEKENIFDEDIDDINDSLNHCTKYQLDKPTFIVTTTDENHLEDTKVSELSTQDDNVRKTWLNVQNHSKDEITDDEDSGVTSDNSRIISEVDSDSEHCHSTTTTTVINTTPVVSSVRKIPPPVVKRSQKVYNRTQTHSRLFRLLSDEHMKLPNENDNSPSSPEIIDPTLPDLTEKLPARPKSLNCEALFKQQEDSYNKNSDSGRAITINPLLTRPRVGVYCPRTRSSKNLPQIMRLRQQASARPRIS